MKKVVLLATAAALVVLASCKQSGTCTCKVDGEVAYVQKVEDQKKAKAQCEGKFTDVATEEGDEDGDQYTCEWEK